MSLANVTTNLVARKISPGGLVNIPFVDQLALGFEKGKSKKVGIVVNRGAVIISDKVTRNAEARKVSPRGLLQLTRDSRKLLLKSERYRYSLKVDKKNRRILLRPV